MGENIAYMWVEKLRQLLHEKKDKGVNFSANPNATNPTNTVRAEFVAMLNLNSNAKPDVSKDEGQSNDTEHIAVPEIFTGKPFTDRKSTFQAHVAPITDERQVK